MDEMECLVPMDLKDREERPDLRDQLEVGEKRESKDSRSPWPKEWWSGLHKVGEKQLPKHHWN